MNYYEALRLRVKMERLASVLVAVFAGTMIGAYLMMFDWVWVLIIVKVLILVSVVLSWAASDGLQKRINDGEFDTEDSSS